MKNRKDYVFAAFLRGINVGGNNPVKMSALRTALENAGFEGVRTILASGNVVFESKSKSESTLATDIQECIKSAFGKDISVIVRTIDELQRLVGSDPFKKINPDAKTKLYVTFLPDGSSPVTSRYKSPKDPAFEIVQATKREILSYIVISPGIQSTDLMTWLHKNYGKCVTTRNWNTIVKVLRATGQ